MNDKLDVKTGVTDTLPTVFGYIGIGLAFGVVGRSAGLSPWIIALMSLVTYGGSAQFVTVSMLQASSPLASIVLSTFLVNSRMILMAMNVAPYFSKESMSKNILIGSFLTDETFALSMNKKNRTGGILSFEWFNSANLIAYVTWAASSYAGGVLGSFIGNPERFGMDFALVAMFVGLLYLQIIADDSLAKGLQFAMVFVTLALVFLGMIFIPKNLLVVFVTLVGCGIGVALKHAFC